MSRWSGWAGCCRWQAVLPWLAASMVGAAAAQPAVPDLAAEPPAVVEVTPAPLPTFAELEAAGARIGEVRVVNKNIFDLDDPKENNALFRTANALHIRTRVGVIRRALLFKSGDPVSVTRIDETERLLRSTRYLYDVRIRPIALHDGVVDVEVVTHDTWTFDPGVSVGRSGGATSGGINLREYNLLGTGTTVGIDRSRDVDRTSTQFSVANDRMFGTWMSISYSRANNSDGSSEALALVRPFYSLDANWSAGAKGLRDDRLEPVYNAGQQVSEYRHRKEEYELLGGWSAGRDNGWVRRYSVGLSSKDDAYAFEPGRVAPAALPADETLVGPFLRFDLIEDRFEKVQNRNQIGRPEFFALGLQARVQVGRALSSLGSTRQPWLYEASVSRGFETLPEHSLFVSAKLSGQYEDGKVLRQQAGASTQYYLPHHRRWLFYASVSGDTLTNPDANQSLLIGGDSDLRGYPLRYQAGTRRAVLTLEERYHTDYFPFRLFRLGGAAFVDYGRAWGGGNVNLENPGWLADVGFGLRIFSVRAAFSNVLHVDLAFPLDADANVKKVQFNVKTKASF